MIKIIISGVEYSLTERLEGFEVSQKPSSNVEFFGANKTSGQVFVQFRSGSTYIYNDVPAHVIDDMNKAGSIDTFVSQNIAKVYQFKHYPERMVRRFPVVQG